MKIKTILVSQPKPADVKKSPYYLLGEKYKLKIDFRKFISIVGVSAKEFRQTRVNILEHTAIILTSRNAVDHFFRLCEELRITVPDSMKYFCISESTAFYLQKYVQYRKRKIFFGKQKFAELLDIMKKHKDEKFLLPCSETPKTEIIKGMDEFGFDYSHSSMYKVVPSNLSDVDIKKYDMLVFFSPSGVKSLFHNFPEYKQDESIVAAFGPTTARAINEAGLKLNVSAPTQKSPSMTMAIEEFLNSNGKKR